MDFDFSTETITPDNSTVLTIGGNGALMLPVGTSAQRPVSPAGGMLRLNSTGYTAGPALEYYDSSASAWEFLVDGSNIISGGGFSVQVDNVAGQVIITSASGGAGTNFSYNARTNTQAAADPADGNMVWNSATLLSSTQLYISAIDGNGIDQTNYFNTLNVGAQIYLQDQNDSTIFQRWFITSITYNVGTPGWYTIGVTLINSNNFATISNNHKIYVSFSGSGNVTSFRTSLSGLTPSTATAGSVVLAGTLGATSGGTGSSSSPTSGQFLYSGAGTTYTPTALDSVAVTTFAGGTTGLTPASATSGAITLAGTLAVANGGTGLLTTPVNGQLLIGNGTGYTLASLTAGTGISVTNGSGTITVANSGILSVTGTTNQVTASTTSGAVTLSTPVTFTAPGYVAITSGLYESSTASISAAGTTQGTATVLTTSYNVVTTVAVNTGVILPVPTLAGWKVTIVNRGANTLNIYPNVGGAINGGTTNTAVTLAVNASTTLENSNTTASWYTVSTFGASGSGTVTSITATQPAAGLTITGSPITTAGTLTFALANDLLGVEGLATTGIATRTATDTWTTRTITGTTNTITVTAGNGIAGNPTITIADNPILPGTSGMILNSGTTAQRPVSPVNGTIRYNTTLGATEMYQNGAWFTIAGTSSGNRGIINIYTGPITAATGTSVVPWDNTPPLITEGTQIWTRTLTPVLTTSEFKITVQFTVDCGTSNRIVISSVFRDNVNIGSALFFATGGGRPATTTLSITDSPGVITPVVYTMRTGIGSGSGQWYINSTSSGNNLGGVLVSAYQITEVG